MNRKEERLIWACALDLFTAPVLQGLVFKSIEHIHTGMRDCDIPRFASAEGMSEVTGQLLEAPQQGRRPLLHDFLSLHREHLRAWNDIRFAIAGRILGRVPEDHLTPRLSDLGYRIDLGL